jgi:hypothetical protein
LRVAAGAAEDRFVMRRFVWVCLAIALVGCEAGGGVRNALGLCSTVCRCAAGLPGQQQACVDECVDEIDTVAIPSACERCVFQNASSCTDLFETCFDGGPCDPDPEPPVPVPDTPMSGVDDFQEEDL